MAQLNSLSLAYKFLLFIWIVTIPMKNSIYQISIALIITLFLAELLKKENYYLFRQLLGTYKDILIGFILIICSMTVSNFLGIQANKIWHIEAMFILRYCFLFFILLYCYAKAYVSTTHLLAMIFFSLALQGIDGLYQHFFDIDFLSGNTIANGVWLTGAVFYYNPFGLLMSIGASLCITFLLYSRDTFSRWQIILLFAFLSLFLYTLVFSLSRSSWVSFIVFTIGLLTLNSKKFSLKYAWVFILLGGLLILLVLNEVDVLHRIQQLLHGNSSHRKEIWKATIEAFLQRPYFGYGLNSYKQVVISESEFNGVHNSLLEILLFLGTFGFLMFSLLILLILREIYRQKSALFFAFFSMFLVASQFDHSVISSKIFLSILTLFAFFVFHNRGQTDAL